MLAPLEETKLEYTSFSPLNHCDLRGAYPASAKIVGAYTVIAAIPTHLEKCVRDSGDKSEVRYNELLDDL